MREGAGWERPPTQRTATGHFLGHLVKSCASRYLLHKGEEVVGRPLPDRTEFSPTCNLQSYKTAHRREEKAREGCAEQTAHRFRPRPRRFPHKAGHERVQSIVQPLRSGVIHTHRMPGPFLGSRGHYRTLAKVHGLSSAPLGTEHTQDFFFPSLGMYVV